MLGRCFQWKKELMEHHGYFNYWPTRAIMGRVSPQRQIMNFMPWKWMHSEACFEILTFFIDDGYVVFAISSLFSFSCRNTGRTTHALVQWFIMFEIEFLLWRTIVMIVLLLYLGFQLAWATRKKTKVGSIFDILIGLPGCSSFRTCP